MRKYKLPKLNNFLRIYRMSPFPKIISKLALPQHIQFSITDVAEYKRKLDLHEYIIQLNYRLADAAKSYVLMLHFYGLGIPDKEWYISPGKSGSSVEYFPHFIQSHHLIKDWFDFYSDAFYSKAFSAFEMIGHILNLYYNLDLGENEVSFNRVLERLGQQNAPIDEKLINIRSDYVYGAANEIRNAATHRVLSSTTGMMVSQIQNGWGFGMKKYITSSEIVENAEGLLSLVDQVIDSISVCFDMIRRTQKMD